MARTAAAVEGKGRPGSNSCIHVPPSLGQVSSSSSSSSSGSSAQQALEQALREASKHAGGEDASVACWATAGWILLSCIVACTAAAPMQLPRLCLVLGAAGLPWRVYSFGRRRWAFFLLDYCYLVNAMAAVYIVLTPSQSPRQRLHWLAANYTLSEGPLAAALIMWQCAWVPGSVDHITSVLMHMLPGLVMYTQRHLPTDQPLTATAPTRPFLASGMAGAEAAVWLFVVPTAVYLAWQFVYWVIVQVMCRRLIKARGYDTSFKSMARRAQRADSPLWRLAQTGGTSWKLFIFGGGQLLFTLATFALGIACFYSPLLASLWQVVKLAVPLYYGALYQASKATEQASRRVVRSLAVQGWASPEYLQLLTASGEYSPARVGIVSSTTGASSSPSHGRNGMSSAATVAAVAAVADHAPKKAAAHAVAPRDKQAATGQAFAHKQQPLATKTNRGKSGTTPSMGSPESAPNQANSNTKRRGVEISEAGKGFTRTAPPAGTATKGGDGAPKGAGKGACETGLQDEEEGGWQVVALPKAVHRGPRPRASTSKVAAGA